MQKLKIMKYLKAINLSMRDKIKNLNKVQKILSIIDRFIELFMNYLQI